MGILKSSWVVKKGILENTPKNGYFLAK